MLQMLLDDTWTANKKVLTKEATGNVAKHIDKTATNSNSTVGEFL
jgi:hypothetical protein